MGKKILGQRNFGSKKKLGPKQMLSPQQFWVQKIWVQKKFGSNLDQKQIRSKKFWGEKKFGPEGGSKLWDKVHWPIWRLHTKSRLPAMPRILQKVFNICPSDKHKLNLIFIWPKLKSKWSLTLKTLVLFLKHSLTQVSWGGMGGKNTPLTI